MTDPVTHPDSTATWRESSPSTVDLGDDERQAHHEAFPERDEKGEWDPFLVRFEAGDPACPKVRPESPAFVPLAKVWLGKELVCSEAVVPHLRRQVMRSFTCTRRF